MGPEAKSRKCFKEEEGSTARSTHKMRSKNEPLEITGDMSSFRGVDGEWAAWLVQVQERLAGKKLGTANIGVSYNEFCLKKAPK